MCQSTCVLAWGSCVFLPPALCLGLYLPALRGSLGRLFLTFFCTPPPPLHIVQGRDNRLREPPPFIDPRQALDFVHGGDAHGTVLPPRPQNPQHPGETSPPAAVRRPPDPGDGAGAGTAGALEGKNTEAVPERPPPAQLPSGGSPKGVDSVGGGGSGGATPTVAGAGAEAVAHHTPASGRGGGVGAFGDPADGVHLAYEGGGGVIAEAGPMEAFLARGGKLPVLLLTCNRAQLLGQTIEVSGLGG